MFWVAVSSVSPISEQFERTELPFRVPQQGTAFDHVRKLPFATVGRDQGRVDGHVDFCPKVGVVRRTLDVEMNRGSAARHQVGHLADHVTFIDGLSNTQIWCDGIVKVVDSTGTSEVKIRDSANNGNECVYLHLRASAAACLRASRLCGARTASLDATQHPARS